MKRIAFTAHKQADLIETPGFTEPIKPGDIRGRTLVSLVSPGTELNSGFLGSQFPNHPGYACVFQVDEIGSDVRNLIPGAIVFGSGNHTERQEAHHRDVLEVPASLSPETAVFARLAGVSMSTLNVTVVRPPARVLVTGLGPVGILAAQIFDRAGYAVTAIDPIESRRRSASNLRLRDIRPAVEIDDLEDDIALHVECSGHEQAVHDGCKCVRKGGEIFLVGVPWRRKTENYSFDLLHAIFHRYVVLRSGWEWQVPRESRDFSQNSIMGNLAAAVGWLADGRLSVKNMGGLYTPDRAQQVYSGLLDQSLPTPTAIFDWR